MSAVVRKVSAEFAVAMTTNPAESFIEKIVRFLQFVIPVTGALNASEQAARSA